MASRRSRPTGTSPFYAAAQQLHAAAAGFQPQGMLEVYREFQEMPFSLTEIANAFRIRAEACSPSNAPLHQALAQMLIQLAAAMDAAAVTSQQLAPAMVALHPELQRLLQPRANEGAWDTTRNPA